MIAIAIPQSNGYPEGVKYRFQYMAEADRTLLRFDSFPDHPGVDSHHYHRPDGVDDDSEYTGLNDHVQKFYNAMDDHRER